MYIKSAPGGFVLTFEGYFDEGKFHPSKLTTAAVRITLGDVHGVFEQFEALGQSDAQEVSIKIGRFTYDLKRHEAKELLAIISMVQFDEEPLPIQHTAPEEFWTEDYLQGL